MNEHLVPGGHWGGTGSFMWSGQLRAICGYGSPCESTTAHLGGVRKQMKIKTQFTSWMKSLWDLQLVRNQLLGFWCLVEIRSFCLWFEIYTRAIRFPHISRLSSLYALRAQCGFHGLVLLQWLQSHSGHHPEWQNQQVTKLRLELMPEWCCCVTEVNQGHGTASKAVACGAGTLMSG